MLGAQFGSSGSVHLKEVDWHGRWLAILSQQTSQFNLKNSYTKRVKIGHYSIRSEATHEEELGGVPGFYVDLFPLELQLCPVEARTLHRILASFFSERELFCVVDEQPLHFHWYEIYLDTYLFPRTESRLGCLWKMFFYTDTTQSAFCISQMRSLTGMRPTLVRLFCMKNVYSRRFINMLSFEHYWKLPREVV